MIREAAGDAAIVVSSGRGVHEALARGRRCAKSGLGVGVVDMPSIDDQLLLAVVRLGRLLLFAEQNNGYICRTSSRSCIAPHTPICARGLAINTLDASGRPRFIHSGTYEELTEAFGLTPPQSPRRSTRVNA